MATSRGKVARSGNRGLPLADTRAMLDNCGITCQMMTQEELIANIAKQEQARQDDAALTGACVEALRSTGEPWPEGRSLRVVRGWSPNGTPLPGAWDVMIERDEVPVLSALLPAPFVGYVAVISKQADIPKPVFDEEQLARALACALVADVSR